MLNLVVGSSGRIGQACLKHVRATTAWNIRSTRNYEELKAEIMKLDRPTAIINCAAYTMVDKAEKEQEECYDVNVSFVNKLVNLAECFAIPLVHFSTDFVFGSLPADAKLRQRVLRDGYYTCDLPNPHGYYAMTKNMSEMIVLKYKHGIVCRVCGVYSQYKGDFLSSFLQQADTSKADSVLMVNRQGYSNPTYADDVALAVDRMLGDGLRGLFHVVNPDPCSWFDFFSTALILADMKEHLPRIQLCKPEWFNMVVRRPLYSVLGVGELESRGVKMPSWRSSLPKMIQHYSNLKEQQEKENAIPNSTDVREGNEVVAANHG